MSRLPAANHPSAVPDSGGAAVGAAGEGPLGLRTCEGDLGVTVLPLLLDAVLVRLGATAGALHVTKVLAPALPAGVLLEPLFLGPAVLEPHLRGGGG